MITISHRGYWESPNEKNSVGAFERSFRSGFGVETDLRDMLGSIVISHDIPEQNAPSFIHFLQLPRPAGLPLALNIKADGLAPLVKLAIDQAGMKDDAFVFDMSIPDTRAYLELKIPVFARMSEVERAPAWIEDASGVWLDSFYDTWFDNELVGELVAAGKRVCVVSPELHGRAHQPLWKQLRELPIDWPVFLCTDMPLESAGYFGG